MAERSAIPFLINEVSFMAEYITHSRAETVALGKRMAALQHKQDEAFRAVSLRRLLTGGSDPQDTSKL